RGTARTTAPAGLHCRRSETTAPAMDSSASGSRLHLAAVARHGAAHQRAIDGIGDIDAPAHAHRTGLASILDAGARAQDFALRRQRADRGIVEVYPAVLRARDR